MVLIDTAGMAQRDVRTRELLEMVSHRSIDKLLAVNAAAQGETIEDLMISYHAATCRGLVICKIDEAVKLRRRSRPGLRRPAQRCGAHGPRRRGTAGMNAAIQRRNHTADARAPFAPACFEAAAAMPRALPQDQADGLRRLFGAQSPRFMAVVANPEMAFSGLVLERLARACSAAGRRTLVVDAAPLAEVVVVHAEAPELGCLFTGRAVRPLLLAADHPATVTQAYAGLKLLAQRHSLMAFGLLLAAAPHEPRVPRIARHLALTADRFVGAALHDWACIDPTDSEVPRAVARLVHGLLHLEPELETEYEPVRSF